MELNNFCCIGAELKNIKTESSRMAQIYFYRAYEEETIDDMLKDGFFNIICDRVKQDDIILLYSPKTKERIFVWSKVIENKGGIIKLQSLTTNAIDIIVGIENFKTLTGENLQEILEDIDDKLYINNEEFITLKSNKLQEILKEIDTKITYYDPRNSIYNTNVALSSNIDDNTTIEISSLSNKEGYDNNVLGIGSLVYDSLGTSGYITQIDGDSCIVRTADMESITSARKNKDFITNITAFNKGLTNAEANTEISASNKIATMTEINAITNGNYLGKSFWYGKTIADFSVPVPTDKKQSYIDFTNNQVYDAKEDLTGWNLKETISPADVEMILITSKFWDIPESGFPGTAIYSTQSNKWAYFPRKAGQGDNETIEERQPDGALQVKDNGITDAKIGIRNVGKLSANTEIIVDNTEQELTSWIKALSEKVNGVIRNFNLPNGIIFIWGSNQPIPEGYLPCQGGAVSRTLYKDLFAKIGTIWGAGDGSTTFNLPNFDEYTVWQRGDRQIAVPMNGAVPNITGYISCGLTYPDVFPASGVFTKEQNPLTPTVGGGYTGVHGNFQSGLARQNFDASRSSSIYQNGINGVLPKSRGILFIIKY